MERLVDASLGDGLMVLDVIVPNLSLDPLDGFGELRFAKE
jgi:hypothetical protein